MPNRWISETERKAKFSYLGGNKMREIKFRVWDKKDKKMIDSHACKVNFQRYIADNAEMSASDVEMTQRYVPMMFTGLYDRDNCDIYEGDVLAQYSHGRARAVYLKKVVWKDSGFNITSGQNRKVIGNVYQNPELLKGEIK